VNATSTNVVNPWLLLVCVGCFALGVAAIGLPVLVDNGFPLDDSWIHQVVGRNAASLGTPGFVAGTASSGSSSVLWPWIIALNYRLLPWVAPVTYLFVFNCCCLLVVILTPYRSAAEDGLPKLETALLAGLPALTGNCVWLLSTGMEHLLLIAATFSAAAFWFPTSSPRPILRALLAGCACGVAVVMRPEVYEWFNRVLKYAYGVNIGDFGNRVLIVIAAALLLAGMMRLLRCRARRTAFLVLLAMTNFSIYSLMLPVPGHGMRYLAMSLVFVFPLLALGAVERTERICVRIGTGGISRHYASVVAAAAVTGLALVSLFNWMRITDAGIKHINGTHVLMGRWLNLNLPQNSTVASFDIGGIGYFSGDSIIDLGGVGRHAVAQLPVARTPGRLPARRGGSIPRVTVR
jgi:hypothetical protein